MILLATPLCNYGRGFCLIDVGTEGFRENSDVCAVTDHEPERARNFYEQVRYGCTQPKRPGVTSE